MKLDDKEEYEEEIDFNESLFCYAKEEALKIKQEYMVTQINND